VQGHRVAKGQQPALSQALCLRQQARRGSGIEMAGKGSTPRQRARHPEAGKPGVGGYRILPVAAAPAALLMGIAQPPRNLPHIHAGETF
jgi:hypothetical protein